MALRVGCRFCRYAAQCRKAVQPGVYDPMYVEKGIEEFCSLVWAEALAKWPWLAKYRWVYGCGGVRQGWEGSGRE